MIQIFQSKPSRVMLTWAWKEEIPIHACQTVPSPLQEGRAHARAESRLREVPRCRSWASPSARSRRPWKQASLELRWNFIQHLPSLGQRPFMLFIINIFDLEKVPQPDKEKHLSVTSGPSGPTYLLQEEAPPAQMCPKGPSLSLHS